MSNGPAWTVPPRPADAGGGRVDVRDRDVADPRRGPAPLALLGALREGARGLPAVEEERRVGPGVARVAVLGLPARRAGGRRPWRPRRRSSPGRPSRRCPAGGASARPCPRRYGVARAAPRPARPGRARRRRPATWRAPPPPPRRPGRPAPRPAPPCPSAPPMPRETVASGRVSASRVARVMSTSSPVSRVAASTRAARLTASPMTLKFSRPAPPIEPATTRPVLMPDADLAARPRAG